MAIQFKRGTGTANDAYTGLDGEISIDFTNELIRVHNGTTAGGVFSVGASSSTGSTDLSVNYTTTSFTVASSTGTNAVVNAASGTTAGAMSSADKSKLDGIEDNATADQTASEIKTAYESNTNTNAYTDSEKTKLAGVATGADNYSSWTISDGTNSEPIGSGSSLIVADGGATTATYNPTDNTLTISSTDTDTTYTAGTGLTLTGTTFSLNGEVYTSGEKTKLSGIEAGADVNEPIASTAEAQAGTNNLNTMTPLRTFEALSAGNWSADFGVL